MPLCLIYVDGFYTQVLMGVTEELCVHHVQWRLALCSGQVRGCAGSDRAGSWRQKSKMVLLGYYYLPLRP